MDPLGDPLTTRPILTGWECTMEPYPSGQFGFVDDPDRQFGNSSVWTRTRTRSDGPEPLLTLVTECHFEKHPLHQQPLNHNYLDGIPGFNSNWSVYLIYNCPRYQQIWQRKLNYVAWLKIRSGNIYFIIKRNQNIPNMNPKNWYKYLLYSKYSTTVVSIEQYLAWEATQWVKHMQLC